MSAFTLATYLLFAYIAGIILVGIPMAAWSIHAWRNRNGKKNRALSFLFPINCETLGESAFRQGIGTYECGRSLLHSMVSERALLNSVCNEDTDAQLACARYVFVSALAWPIRSSYLIVAGILIFLVNACVTLATDLFPTWGGKLILKGKKLLPF